MSNKNKDPVDFVRRAYNAVHEVICSVFRVGVNVMHIAGDRLLAWRGIPLTLGVLLIFIVATTLYGRIHGYDLVRLFSLKEFSLPEVGFIERDGFTRIAVEVAYWSSVGVLVRRLNASSKLIRQTDFDLFVTLNDIFVEWFTLPIMSTFAVYFLGIVQINLGEGNVFSVPTADIGVIILLGFGLGFLGSDDARGILLGIRHLFKHMRQGQSGSEEDQRQVTYDDFRNQA